MNHYIIYDQSTGRVDSAYSSSSHINLQVGEGFLPMIVDQEANENLHYVDLELGDMLAKQNQSFQINKTQINADGTDEFVVSGLPENTLVSSSLDGVLKFQDAVGDGEFVFETNMPGQWKFEIDAVQYLKQEIEIEAISAN